MSEIEERVTQLEKLVQAGTERITQLEVKAKKATTELDQVRWCFAEYIYAIQIAAQIAQAEQLLANPAIRSNPAIRAHLNGQ